jgi:hypothetical protein
MKQVTPNPLKPAPKRGRTKKSNAGIPPEWKAEIEHLVELVRAEEGDAAAEARRVQEQRSARLRFAAHGMFALIRVVDIVMRIFG